MGEHLWVSEECVQRPCGRREHEEFGRLKEASMAEAQKTGRGREWLGRNRPVGWGPDLAGPITGEGRAWFFVLSALGNQQKRWSRKAIHFNLYLDELALAVWAIGGGWGRDKEGGWEGH